MARNRTTIEGAPEEVFAVLLDPYQYPRWVVGARRIRAVDPSWPEVGSRFHHAIGAGAELRDNTKIVGLDPPRRLDLEVRFRPIGVAEVQIEVEPADVSSALVTMTERPIDGPLLRLYRSRLPIDWLIWLRNAWALRRLRRLVRRRVAAR